MSRPTISTPQQFLERKEETSADEEDRLIGVIERWLVSHAEPEFCILLESFSSSTSVAVRNKYREAGWVAEIKSDYRNGFLFHLKLPEES